MSTRYGRIQVRHDSAEHWVARNPVLFEGEWGFETDTGQAKIGVGKTWIETDYFSGHQEELTAQLAAEKEDRQNADAAIENHIARVKEGCEQADQSLAEHNDETNQRLAGEIDDRITGDKNLQVQVARLADEFDKLLAGIDDIDGEQIEIILQSAARLEDLLTLNEELQKEKAYRIEADEQEKKARQDADAALTAYNLSQDKALEEKIEEEAKAREDADLALNELIADEAKAREEADEVLKDQFDADQFRQDTELERIENEFKVDQDRQDKELADYKQEAQADQDRQDKELADYKQEVQADQDRQDQALQDEIDARVQRDSLHDAEIDTLEYKLDALLGLTFRGTYTFKHEADCDAEYATCMAAAGGDFNAQQACTRDYVSCEQDKVLAGCFEAVDPDDQFDHLEQIVISKNDASNVEINWAGVLSAGDYLEVDHVLAGSLDKTNYGLYRIAEEPEATTNARGEEVYTMKLQFLQGDGVMLVDEKYEIRGIATAEGVNPEELADFLTKEQAAATYLPLAGGMLTGTLNMKDTAAVKTRHLDSGNNSNLQIKRNGETKITVGTNSVLFNKIPTCATNPAADDDLTRKKWVADNYSPRNHGHSGYASSSHTHSGYASSSHNHDSSYVKGNYTITKSGNLYLIS